MNPLLMVLSLLFGLMPFHRKNPSSPFIIDYAIVLLVPCGYLFCYFYVNFYGYGIYQLEQCNSICRLSNKLFMHVGCFLYLTIYFVVLLRRKNFYIEFQQKLAEIDLFIEQCEQVASEKVEREIQIEKRYMFFITWAVALVVFGYALYFDFNGTSKFYGNFCFFSNMVITFPFVVGSVVQGMFISYVKVVATRFRLINALFEKINRESERRNAPIAVFDIESDAKKTLADGAKNDNNTPVVISDLAKEELMRDKKALQQQQKMNEKNKKKRDYDDVENDDDEDSEDDVDSDDDNEDLYDLDETRANDGPTSETNMPGLFRLHDKILSLSVLVNAEFGAQCVPYMAACFAITIFGIFLETKVMFIVGGKDALMDFVIYIYVLWSFTTMFVGYLVLRLCCNTNAQSKQSAMIVHEIMQKKPTFMLGNDLYYNKMKVFTLQFLHWENYFQFNGIGLFALDYTFIFSTVSAATSYLIVLLQFDMTGILKNEGLTVTTSN